MIDLSDTPLRNGAAWAFLGSCFFSSPPAPFLFFFSRCLLALLLFASALLIAQPQNALTGRWIVTADFYGTPLTAQMELDQQGDKLTGKFGGDKLEGTVKGNTIHFLAKDQEGGSEEINATLQNGAMAGTAIFTDGSDPSHPATQIGRASCRERV